MPRPMWSGSISFGLINIPVKLYSASRERELRFHLLHDEDYSPIRYARICRKDGKEIPYDRIVRGYEYQKGDYVVLNDEDFKSADVKRTKTIDIFGFTDAKEIDPIYFDRPYYVEPDERAGKAYVILRDALRKSGKVGMAKFVLRNKEHLGALKADKNILTLDQLRFDDEIVKPEITVPKETSSSKEIDMALQLINALSDRFEPEKYHDAYAGKLKKIIAQKAKGKPIRVATEEEPVPTAVPDIMDVLRRSLEREREKK